MRVLAGLGRADAEVWAALQALPRDQVECYAARFSDEPAAAVARRVLDRQGAYR